MQINFSQQVMDALKAAEAEARQFGHDYIGTEHMLLGLIRDDEGAVVKRLGKAGVRASEVRTRMRETLRPGKGGQVDKFPYTSRGKKVIELAMAYSRETGTGDVQPEDLLVALLGEEKGIAAQVLTALGITLEQFTPLLPDVAHRGWVREEKRAPEPSANRTAPRRRALRTVLNLAGDEAHRLRHDYVGTEHLLLGLLRAEEGLAGKVLSRAHLTVAEVRARIESLARPGHAGAGVISPDTRLPLTSRAKEVLAMAEAVAGEFGTADVETEHLLLGLLAEKKGYAAQALESLGLKEELARRLVRQLSAGNEGSAQRRSRFRISIDESSDESIYQQIVNRIQEAAATGVLQPNDQLPTVRQLADEIDIAPGTVARAYRELEQRGVVVTKGIRGTRIAAREAVANRGDQMDALSGLLRPVAVAAFHMGASSQDLRAALEQSMHGIFPE